MKILFITDNFPPEVNAPATRTYEHCQEWIKSGAEVTIITCFPNFPDGKIYKGYKNRLYQKEHIDGVDVIRVWSYMTSNIGLFKRVLDYFSFSFMSFWVGLFQKSDIIVATSPQFFTTWAAWGLSKIKRKPWIFELRDIWPESIQSVGAIKHSMTLNILEKIELALYRDADRVVAVTDAFKKNLIARGVDGDKISVVTNGSNIELFNIKNKNQELIKELNLEDKFIIGYIGTHGMAHSLDFIIKSISKIDDDSIHFLFIGNGAVKDKIVKLAEELNLRNITFLDSIKKELVPKYLSIVDVSLAPLKKSDTFKSVIPSKIFEASAMQKPTLLGVEGEAQKIIKRYGAGVCYEPENEEDFIEKIYLLKNDTKLYNSLKKGCMVLASAYNRKKLAKKMLDILYSLEKIKLRSSKANRVESLLKYT
ncbi:glycosyltransferase family 4 protein [Sulfurovum sp. bin170]|uniref:glycosyltransferase family 4 protein n=1 Tax=Sulfurovum sp. bin170 TaxID=2695268 RepID=UPI0013E021B2|nr:glycosyltransferase family 4 protein [Sulfurovum sp. bin170]NEW61215.1 glycosyltransferase family 4 protein [Sulfurovum sp. bin170]